MEEIKKTTYSSVAISIGDATDLRGLALFSFLMIPFMISVAVENCSWLSAKTWRSSEAVFIGIGESSLVFLMFVMPVLSTKDEWSILRETMVSANLLIDTSVEAN